MRWAAAIACLLAATAAPAATVLVDCAAPSAEPPLSKSFVGVYQTPFWFKRHPPGSADCRQLVALLREAGVHDLRYELAWGKPDAFAPDQVAADAHGRPRLDGDRLGPFLHDLADAGVTPLLALGYCPTPLQRGPPGWQRWKDAPTDLTAWADVCQQALAAWAFCRPTFEVWNEPDLPGDGGKVFFAGDAAAYAEVFAATPVRPVGGPAVAYDPGYVPAAGGDFVSVHAYGNAHRQLAAIRPAAGRRPMWLTEYASYPDAALPGSSHGHAAAAAFFADVRSLLAEPGLAKVYWAQWVDDSIGMVDEHLHRRALFNALAAYQTLLPTPRRPAVADGVGAMAAADDAAAAVAVWNTGDRDASATVTLAHTPASAVVLRAFRIDGHHASFGDDPAADERLAESDRSAVAGRTAVWAGVVPAGSVVVVRVDAGR